MAFCYVFMHKISVRFEHWKFKDKIKKMKKNIKTAYMWVTILQISLIIPVISVIISIEYKNEAAVIICAITGVLMLITALCFQVRAWILQRKDMRSC